MSNLSLLLLAAGAILLCVAVACFMAARHDKSITRQIQRRSFRYSLDRLDKHQDAGDVAQ